MNLQKRFEIIWAAYRMGMTVTQYRTHVRRQRLFANISEQITKAIAACRDWSNFRSWSETLKEVRHTQNWVKYLSKYGDLDAWISSQEDHWSKMLAIHQQAW